MLRFRTKWIFCFLCTLSLVGYNFEGSCTYYLSLFSLLTLCDNNFRYSYYVPEYLYLKLILQKITFSIVFKAITLFAFFKVNTIITTSSLRLIALKQYSALKCCSICYTIFSICLKLIKTNLRIVLLIESKKVKHKIMMWSI